LYFDYDSSAHGINANVKTKPIALSYFKQDVEQDVIKINSGEMIKELNYYEEIKPGIFAAKKAANCHDDTISSAYWVSYMLRTRYMDDVMYYANKTLVSSEVINEETEQDSDILNSFNKYIRKPTDADIFRNSLSR
jgi:hypothetical protein